MPNRANKPTGPVPEFLKQSIGKKIKEDLRTAYAMFLNAMEETPQASQDKNVSVRQLHAYLKQLDSSWQSIHNSQIITSGERKLI